MGNMKKGQGQLFMYCRRLPLHCPFDSDAVTKMDRI